MPAKILIVDDHAAIRSVIDTILTNAGYECIIASFWETALKMARRFKFDLVILDVNMPRMSGLQVLGRIRRWTSSGLMVTAVSSVDTVREAVALGCDGYIAKPIEPGLLLSRVKRSRHEGPPLTEAVRAGGLHGQAMVNNVSSGGVAWLRPGLIEATRGFAGFRSIPREVAINGFQPKA